MLAAVMSDEAGVGAGVAMMNNSEPTINTGNKGNKGNKSR